MSTPTKNQEPKVSGFIVQTITTTGLKERIYIRRSQIIKIHTQIIDGVLNLYVFAGGYAAPTCFVGDDAISFLSQWKREA